MGQLRPRLVLVCVGAISGCRGASPPPSGTGALTAEPESSAARALLAAHQQRFQVQPPAERAAGAHRRAPRLTKPFVALQPSAADHIERAAGGLVPHVPRAAQAAAARAVSVTMPASADQPFHLADAASKVSVHVALAGAGRVSAQVADGYVVYPAAYEGGADVLHRPLAGGLEDFIAFEKQPAKEEVAYRIELGAGVAGLRLVENNLEFLDADGTPRLAVGAPWLLDNKGVHYDATLSLEGCKADNNPAAPWQRAVTPPGAQKCTVRIAWAGQHVAYPALLDPLWNSTANDMTVERYNHTSTSLGSGQVLVCGGLKLNSSDTTDCRLYSPGSDTFAVTGALPTPLENHSAVLLDSGNVLIAAGGSSSSTLAGTNSYIYSGGVWRHTKVGGVGADTNLNEGRYLQVAIKLANGDVIVAGGDTEFGQMNVHGSPSEYPASQTAEIFDHTTESWTFTNNNLPGPKNNFTGILLPDNRALFVGGSNGNNITSTSFLYTVGGGASIAGTWSTVNLNGPRQESQVVLLTTGPDSGKVMVAGGDNGTAGPISLNTWELFDPAANAGAGGWAVGPGTMVSDRDYFSMTRLSTGKVLLAGGESIQGPGNPTRTAEVFDPVSRVFSATQNMVHDRNRHTAHLLSNGKVLALAGYSSDAFGPTATAETYAQLALGAACTANNDCASGFCAGGFCCNSACTPGPHETTSCATGTCTATCDTGFGDCDGNALDVNGCETDFTAFATCGKCTTCDDGDACTHDVCNIVAGTGVCKNTNVNACSAGCSGAAMCGFVDTDADGLNDTWETNGYIDLNCNGFNDVGTDTPLPGANVKEPDVYVKWDYMATGGHTHLPSPAAMAAVVTAFGSHHTHLHYFPSSDMIAEKAVVSLAASGAVPPCAGPDAVSLYDLKAVHFPAYLNPAYHYVVFSHFNTCDSIAHCATCPASAKTGAAPPFGLSGIAELPGNDFIVSLGSLVDAGVDPMPDIINSGTFMHELGHNLVLHHGGADDLIQKPNYFSVLNYSYQFGIGTTAAPGPYPSSTTDPSTAYHIDYSSFVGGSLKEGVTDGMNGCTSDGSGGMSEPAGISGGGAGDVDVTLFYADFGGTSVYAPSNGTAVDWDNTPPATDTNVYADVSGDSLCSVLNGYNDWQQATPAAGVFQDTHLSLGFQCNTGFWADGVVVKKNHDMLGNVEDRELTGHQIISQPRGGAFKHVKVLVRPGCVTKWIALSGPGNVPVAALGSASFDVNKVDPASLRFAEIAPVSTYTQDVNLDGFLDIVGNFPMASLHLLPTATSGDMVGRLLVTGQAFGGSDSLTLVPDPNPVVQTKTLNLFEDEEPFKTIEKGLKACTDPPVLPFTLSDCVTSAKDRCNNAIDVNQNGKITRVEFWANILQKDLGKKDQQTMRQAQDTFDHEGCPKFSFHNASANLPFDQLDDLDAQSSFYLIYFTVTDADGATNASCRLNLLGAHNVAANPGRGQVPVPLGCAVCIGTGCGGCASTAMACPESTKQCADAGQKCQSKGECEDYNKKCTVSCGQNDGGGGGGGGGPPQEGY